MRLFSLSITACLISSKNRGLSIRKNKVRGRKGFRFLDGGGVEVTECEGTIDWFSGGRNVYHWVVSVVTPFIVGWKTLPFRRQRPRFSVNTHSIKDQEAFPPRLGRNTFSISLTALRGIVYPSSAMAQSQQFSPHLTETRCPGENFSLKSITPGNKLRKKGADYGAGIVTAHVAPLSLFFIFFLFLSGAAWKFFLVYTRLLLLGNFRDSNSFGRHQSTAVLFVMTQVLTEIDASV
ncbi:hypothetical protein CDAR_250301 [Caerostris darwini]|uniref:Uncharacterized protein n=1 Tax=Caerostris darwini TaxID=1538125 RepID=A0AAV4QLB5_9ARAC|nr:hypothetical protein CDAR_250301 [Caerostris darwini]